jgi:CheY-like chemotaxis protein
MNAMRKVLVVDDDPVVSRSFDRVLGRKGYIVVSAENGLEALSKVAHEEYDAVFTDIKMPGMDGIEVAQQMRARRPWTPVVIITGYGSAEHEARAEAAGVRGFLRKPLSPDMIESSLDAAIAEAVAPVADALPQGGGAVAAAAVAAPRFAAEAATYEAAGEARSVGQFVKNIALFFAAPFIALAYIALFPLLGMVMLARIAGQAWRHGRAAALAAAARDLAEPQPKAAGDASESVGTGQFLKNLAMFFAAPFVALAYIMLFPLIGLVMLAWTAGQAWRKRRALG